MMIKNSADAPKIASAILERIESLGRWRRRLKTVPDSADRANERLRERRIDLLA